MHLALHRRKHHLKNLRSARPVHLLSVVPLHSVHRALHRRKRLLKHLLRSPRSAKPVHLLSAAPLRSARCHRLGVHRQPLHPRHPILENQRVALNLAHLLHLAPLGVWAPTRPRLGVALHQVRSRSLLKRAPHLVGTRAASRLSHPLVSRPKATASLPHHPLAVLQSRVARQRLQLLPLADLLRRVGISLLLRRSVLSESQVVIRTTPQPRRLVLSESQALMQKNRKDRLSAALDNLAAATTSLMLSAPSSRRAKRKSQLRLHLVVRVARAVLPLGLSAMVDPARSVKGHPLAKPRSASHLKRRAKNPAKTTSHRQDSEASVDSSLALRSSRTEARRTICPSPRIRAQASLVAGLPNPSTRSLNLPLLSSPNPTPSSRQTSRTYPRPRTRLKVNLSKRRRQTSRDRDS